MTCYIKRLLLRNFRSYEELSLSFSPTINSFYGKNGEGKTNILEALYFLCTGRSFRTRKLTELIRQGSSGFYLEAEIFKFGIPHLIKASLSLEKKFLSIDGKQMSSFSPLIGLFPSIYFSPSDTSLITASPTIRRRFFDLHLSQKEPLYLHSLLRYYQALKGKNALLRAKVERELPHFEELMAKEGNSLIQKRGAFLSDLEEGVKEWSSLFSEGKDSLAFPYHTSLKEPSPEALLSLLQGHRSREFQWGRTLYGPHLEDFTILLNKEPARTYASEGQKRCAIASIHFAEWRILGEQTALSPLMYIDDFAVFLDRHRKEQLLQSLDKLGQVFLTAPDLIEKGTPFFVEGGKVKQREELFV